MTDLSERELDLLVTTITQRVRDRLRVAPEADHERRGHTHQSGGAASGPAGSSCSGCGLVQDGCGACGLNPLNVVSTWTPPANLPNPREMAKFIDHTLLKPQADREDIETLCQEAKKHQFWSVCVNSTNVRLAKSCLAGSEVQVCAVVGFPLGAGTPGAKAFEAREAIRCGASEIDMVLNIGALRSRDYALVVQDIHKVVQAVPGHIVKVILETGMLDTPQKSIACSLAKVAGAAFVKTSTGFGPGGATAEDIALMRATVGPEMGVKASGGVRTYKDAVNMIKAGANRLGTSNSVAIVAGVARSGSSGY